MGKKGKNEAAVSALNPGQGREETDSPNNIFDTVFRTIVEYLPELVIPVINLAYHTDYLEDAPIKVLKNEHVTRFGKLVTDLFFELGEKYYHVEMQSIPDGKMIIRIVEYAAAIAIEQAQETGDGGYRMRFPASCVIYLRHTGNTPDVLCMRIEFPDGQTAKLEAPVLKAQEITKDEMFRKNLLLLLPYYLMRYEGELKEIGQIDPGRQEEADRRMEDFLREYGEICGRLLDDCEKANKQYLYDLLTEQIQRIAEYLAPSNEKERVKAMGGQVIKPRVQIALEQGIERGIEQGIEQGEEMFVNLALMLRRDGREEDLLHAMQDRSFRKELYAEYGIGRED